MSDPVTFHIIERAIGSEGVAFYIEEDGTNRHAMSFHDYGQVRKPSAKERAEAALALLTAEHASGRVAQARCALDSTRDAATGLRVGGRACDFDRINDVRLLSDAQRSALILCDDHADVVDAGRLAAKCEAERASEGVA